MPSIGWGPFEVGMSYKGNPYCSIFGKRSYVFSNRKKSNNYRMPKYSNYSNIYYGISPVYERCKAITKKNTQL